MTTQTDSPATTSHNLNEDHERSLATKVFLGMLLCVGLLYGIVLAYHSSTPMPTAKNANSHWLERCRQMCAEYGLLYTGNIKDDAEAYLEVVDSQKLSAPLEELLSAPGFERAISEEHPLIGQQAPDFTLVDSHDQQVRLSTLNQNGPIVLVFYYGYNCSHCVAQLFALEKDLEYFRELGAEVIAISADKPAFSREQFAEYGAFTFPVLSDPDYKISEQWGVYVRPSETQQEDLLHGTFIIDRNGKVIFSNRGYQPFLDNQSLLQWIANRTLKQ